MRTRPRSFSCLPPVCNFDCISWKLVCVCPLSEKHSARMKIIPSTSAPSGAKARCRQIFFWAAFLTFVSTTICLAGASDGAPQPDFDEKFSATSFLTINEQIDDGIPDFLLVFNTKKPFLVDNLTDSGPTSTCLPEATDDAPRLVGGKIINTSSTFDRINSCGLILLGESGDNRTTTPRATIDAADACKISRPTNAPPLRDSQRVQQRPSVYPTGRRNGFSWRQSDELAESTLDANRPGRQRHQCSAATFY